uniref:Wx1 n=1 Tax=Arundo donax TaxID=35708 RepID=A0A0A9BZE4_ARUDO
MAAAMTSGPFCSSSLPTNATSGIFRSTGRPTSACNASLLSAFAVTAVAASYLTVMYLSLLGSHSLTSMPLTIPVIPVRRMMLSSSQPLASPEMSSWA